MARKAFFSFHYQLDSWRVQTVRNIGVIEGQPLLGSNKWEDVAKNGAAAIEQWINQQMAGKSCNIVLIGSETAGRRWVQYEFKKAWEDKKGVLGIHIHKLLDQDQRPSLKGRNPFLGFTLKNGAVKLDNVVPVYDPPGTTSSAVYNTISANIADWVEDAIETRSKW